MFSDLARGHLGLMILALLLVDRRFLSVFWDVGLASDRLEVFHQMLRKSKVMRRGRDVGVMLMDYGYGVRHSYLGFKMLAQPIVEEEASPEVWARIN